MGSPFSVLLLWKKNRLCRLRRKISAHFSSKIKAVDCENHVFGRILKIGSFARKIAHYCVPGRKQGQLAARNMKERSTPKHSSFWAIGYHGSSQIFFIDFAHAERERCELLW